MLNIVEKMNLESLETVLSVMKDLRFEAEITGRFNYWELDYSRERGIRTYD
jgi:hypothetical protein